MYSRDEIAVVSGGAGIWISSLAEIVSVQPSGAFVVAGGVDSTLPSSTGGAASGTAADTGVAASGAPGSGSAQAGAAVNNEPTSTITAAPRTNTAPNAFPAAPLVRPDAGPADAPFGNLHAAPLAC